MNFIPIRCECGYCQQCKNDAIVYNECLGCYEGKHPHLPKIQNDFENYMQNTLQTFGSGDKK